MLFVDIWTNEKKKQVAQAIVALAERSDDHEDEFVIESFYDYDVIGHFMNNKNQIVQGSRGMGKTHILKFLEKTLSNVVDKSIYCIFLDCCVNGSGGICGLNDTAESSNHPFNKPTRFFEIFLKRVCHKLQVFYREQYLFEDQKTKDNVFSLLSDLQNSISTGSEVIDNSTLIMVDETDTTESIHYLGNITVSNGTDIVQKRNKENARNISKKRKQNAHTRYSFTFPKFSFTLEELLKITDIRIILLLDEWTFVPPDIQPYFAEFLRRTLLRISRIKLKIAVVPQGNQFQRTINGKNNQNIGFGIGDDIKFELDLDRVYSVDNAPLDIISFCFGFLCKHLSAMLKISITEAEFTYNMFKNDRAAFMLVRASEGNPRDFILLTEKCIRGFLSKENFVINDEKVILKARELYETSKLKNISQSARRLLTKLIKYVIHRHHNRGFLIDQDCLDNSYDLQALINARIIHILKENIMDYDQSVTGNCALLILNFGAYCETLNAGCPINLFVGEDILEQKIFGPKEAKSYDSLLPYDNKRKYYECYVNAYSDNYFDPHFFQKEP